MRVALDISRRVVVGNDRYLTVNTTYSFIQCDLSFILSAPVFQAFHTIVRQHTDCKWRPRASGSARTIKTVLLPTSSSRLFRSTNTVSRSRPTWASASDPADNYDQHKKDPQPGRRGSACLPSPITMTGDLRVSIEVSAANELSAIAANDTGDKQCQSSMLNPFRPK
jgi:hypothetical protein